MRSKYRHTKNNFRARRGWIRSVVQLAFEERSGLEFSSSIVVATAPLNGRLVEKIRKYCELSGKHAPG